MYLQPHSPFWWIRNIRSLIYFVRELTGVFIAFYTIYFLILALQNPTDWNAFLPTKSFRIVSLIGLTAAVFHTVTWLYVTVRISPVPLKKIAFLAAFLFLIGIWLALSFVLIQTDYLYISY